MRELPPLRPRVPAGAERLRPRRERARLGLHHRARVRPPAGRDGLRQLRPVHQLLPGRRAHREAVRCRRCGRNWPIRRRWSSCRPLPAVRVAPGRSAGPRARRAGHRQEWSPRSGSSGFDKVFDTDFTADLTILEEGNELIQRLTTGGKLPLITSCCPGWIKFAEHNFPDLLENISTCKSPQQMFGALAKTYYAEQAGD